MVFGLGGMGDMGKLMKQAQEMQQKMMEAQAKMASLTAEGSAGAGMVSAVANAEGALVRLSVDPSLLDGSEEKEVLEDLIIAAVNDAQAKAKEAGQAEMAKITEGMGLPPGMKMPFG
ncbi:MAG: YbaB/EbfC family nucleoid-associated protein [Pseudomonadota bacterium]